MKRWRSCRNPFFQVKESNTSAMALMAIDWWRVVIPSFRSKNQTVVLTTTVCPVDGVVVIPSFRSKNQTRRYWNLIQTLKDEGRNPFFQVKESNPTATRGRVAIYPCRRNPFFQVKESNKKPVQLHSPRSVVIPSFRSKNQTYYRKGTKGISTQVVIPSFRSKNQTRQHSFNPSFRARSRNPFFQVKESNFHIHSSFKTILAKS